jgi:hypothetical protein
MNFKETKIIVTFNEYTHRFDEKIDVLCKYAAEQIRSYLQTFNQLPRERQVFTHPDYDPYHILIDSIDPLENQIRCYVDFSQT